MGRSKRWAHVSMLGALLLILTSLAYSAEPPPAGGPFETLVQQYLAGEWDELEETLKSKSAELDALTGQRKLDLAYIRQSLSETRPPWWKTVKGGQKTGIRAMVWGRSLQVTYDPAGKGGLQTNYINGKMEIAVSWPFADMDSTAPAEHGFSKGELNNLYVFSMLGVAATWSTLSPQSMVNLNEDQKVLFGRVMDLQSNLAGVYHGSPRARQWGLWIYMHSYLDKYAKMKTINARKAIAVVFLTEVLSNPSKYPSIKLPNALDADNAEEKLALAVHNPIEKQGWTLAEDRSIREALKSFATDNEGVLKKAGLVTFANGLTMSLDPEQDGPLRGKRDAWFKQQFDKIRATAK